MGDDVKQLCEASREGMDALSFGAGMLLGLDVENRHAERLWQAANKVQAALKAIEENHGADNG